MNRIVNILLVCLMGLAAAAVYDMKYEAEAAAERVARLERQVAAEHERISLLKASWSALSQPRRMEELVARHVEELGLGPMAITQLGTLAEIPQKPQLMGPHLPGADAIVTGALPKPRKTN